jgi:hypothetical protein
MMLTREDKEIWEKNFFSAAFFHNVFHIDWNEREPAGELVRLSSSDESAPISILESFKKASFSNKISLKFVRT